MSAVPISSDGYIPVKANEYLKLREDRKKVNELISDILFDYSPHDFVDHRKDLEEIKELSSDV